MKTDQKDLNVVLLFAALFMALMLVLATGGCDDDDVLDVGASTTGSVAMESGSFVIDATTGPGIETEGGEAERGWYSPCLTADADFTTCQRWCIEAELGECVQLQWSDAECVPFGDGFNQLGHCFTEVFTDWPDSDDLRVRCVCSLP
jgi:hypothetical protein